MEKLVMEDQFRKYYKGKKVFVTGNTGFKGAWLMAWLHELGADTLGYALPAEGSSSLFESLSSYKIGRTVIADIRDRKKLKDEIQSFQPDNIFHLAAQALVRKSYEIPTETFDVNVVGTANLLEAVSALPKKCGITIITTDKVYENKEKDYLYKEKDSLGGYDPYSASKACTEFVVSSFRQSFFNPAQYNQHQKAVVTARAGNVIGGGDWNKDRIVPDIVRSLQQSKPIAVRNPLSVRPWQHVLEPISGYLLIGMLLNTRTEDLEESYNLGPAPADHLAVRDLVEAAIKNWGTGSWIDTSDPTQVHEASLLKLDIRLAAEQLNWRPKLAAIDAIQWTINWYKQQVEDRASYTFKQIKEFSKL